MNIAETKNHTTIYDIFFSKDHKTVGRIRSTKNKTKEESEKEILNLKFPRKTDDYWRLWSEQETAREWKRDNVFVRRARAWSFRLSRVTNYDIKGLFR